MTFEIIDVHSHRVRVSEVKRQDHLELEVDHDDGEGGLDADLDEDAVRVLVAGLSVWLDKQAAKRAAPEEP